MTYKNVHDKHGRPILDGDLLRSPHFRGPRRQVFFLYHAAVNRGEYLEAVPVAELATGKKDGGCVRLLTETDSKAFEIIDGHRPFWADRRKAKPEEYST